MVQHRATFFCPRKLEPWSEWSSPKLVQYCQWQFSEYKEATRDDQKDGR